MAKKSEEIGLGDEVMDTVSGIKGIVVVRHDYLYGMPRIGLQPAGSFEGKQHESIHIDLLQAKLVKKGAVSRKGMVPVETIELGALCKCRITQFEGMCVGRAEWLYACTKVLIQPKEIVKKTGQPVESLWLDEPQALLIKAPTKKEAQVTKEARITGGFGKPVSSFKTCKR
jgi:hypothetical protein